MSVLVAVSSQRDWFWPLTRFASRKWSPGWKGLSHPDWVKLSVELNCAPTQNTRFSSSLHYKWLLKITWMLNDFQTVTWWLTETKRWEWYSPPVELKLSSSQKVTVRNECGSHRCSHLSDLGSLDIGRGKRKWSQMIGGGTPNGSGVPFPSTEVNTKKG